MDSVPVDNPMNIWVGWAQSFDLEHVAYSFINLQQNSLKNKFQVWLNTGEKVPSFRYSQFSKLF